ncbi:MULTISPECIES: hypothetical protein [Halorussus]|uniref:hypothetical protein n=1 Tax=Halorussus TaxID=1070314 RepID=UPI0020A17034|nr:hypothetical protein [Halorussus vallis]USZ76190.1 hypothetical protein NGM07_02425 [Halorussus vallis]
MVDEFFEALLAQLVVVSLVAVVVMGDDSPADFTGRALLVDETKVPSRYDRRCAGFTPLVGAIAEMTASETV